MLVLRLVDVFPVNLIGQEVQVIVSDVKKDGTPEARTYFGKLISVKDNFVTIEFSDGSQETYGTVIKITRREK